MTYKLCLAHVSVSGMETRQGQLRCSFAHTWCLSAGREKAEAVPVYQPSTVAGSRPPANTRGRNGLAAATLRMSRLRPQPAPPVPSHTTVARAAKSQPQAQVSATRATRCGAELSPQKDASCLGSDGTHRLTRLLSSWNSRTGFHRQLPQLPIHQSKTTDYLGQQNPQLPSVDGERGKDFSSSVKSPFPASSLHFPAHSCTLSPQPSLCSLPIFSWDHTLPPVINHIDNTWRKVQLLAAPRRGM